MGFWSGVGSVLSVVWDGVQEKSAEMQEEVNKISHLSDRELVEIVKDNGCKMKQRSAAKYILKKHGVIKDD